MNNSPFVDPTHQPSPSASRLEWMTWEKLWDHAATTKDPQLLARLIGQSVDTQPKQMGANRVFTCWVNHPNWYDGKLMRLLLRNGAKIDDNLVAPLCVCGERAILLMKKYGADLRSKNIVGQTGLALCCMISNEREFKTVWRLLRDEGLDPNETDDTLENAFDAARDFGKIELVDAMEAQREASHQASTLDLTTPKTKRVQNRQNRL